MRLDKAAKQLAYRPSGVKQGMLKGELYTYLRGDDVDITSCGRPAAEWVLLNYTVIPALVIATLRSLFAMSRCGK